ncbi:MAG TPA: hypothetical protein DDW59_01925 [Gammaproteobacteria bacterium]|nr:hypothetical protein [Gammaproteobacteria bacterium]
MIERHILLQETSAGLTFVSNEEACATCPGMCFSPKNSASIDSSQGLPATLAISGSTLNRIALYLFAVPLAGLVTAITLSDAVTNAYPLLQVLPVQLSILALFVALLMVWTRVLRRRWLAIDDGLGVRRSSGLKELSTGPTISSGPQNIAQPRIIVSERNHSGQT